MYNHYCAEIKRAFNKDSKAARQQVALIERTSNNALRLLQVLTDQIFGADPAAWSAWWAVWNRTEPVLGTGARIGGLAPVAGVAAPKLHRPRLAAGTVVWTPRGIRRIETLRTGDLVFSQDPASGALGLHGVIAVTGPAPDASISLGLERSDPVAVSPIEPVWKAGEGRIAARDLRVGDFVRVPGGRARLVSTEPDTDRVALNIVFEEVGTLFVGERGMLVHDNSILHPPSQPFDRVPDLATRASHQQPSSVSRGHS